MPGTATAASAGAVPSDNFPDPADRPLVATARDRDVHMVTCDAAILSYAKRCGLVHVIDASA